MNRRFALKALAGVALAAGTALVATGCSAPGSTQSNSGSKSGGVIKIAVVDAQSGQSSSLGAWELKGVKLAVNQANKAGGVDGRKIKLSVYDDQADPTTGTNLARKVSSDRNIFVFGTAESAVTLAMAPILSSENIPMITSGTSPAIAQLHNPMVFLNSPSSTVFDQSLADYLLKDKGYKKIAMISNNGAYGQGEHDAFKAALGSTKPVADQIVTATQTDFSSALTSIRATNPDVLFIGAEEVESGLIAKQARQLGMKAVFAGSSPISTPLYVQTAGVANAAGSVAATPYFGSNYDAQTKKFAAAYKAAYGEEPELHGAKAYDGAEIVLKALKSTNVATGQKLADAIRSTKYKGLVGQFAFDSDGLGVHETHIGIVDKSGALVPYSSK